MRKRVVFLVLLLLVLLSGCFGPTTPEEKEPPSDWSMEDRKHYSIHLGTEFVTDEYTGWIHINKTSPQMKVSLEFMANSENKSEDYVGTLKVMQSGDTRFEITVSPDTTYTVQSASISPGTGFCYQLRIENLDSGHNLKGTLEIKVFRWAGE